MTPESGQYSRREREMMEIVFRLGRATAQDVLSELEDPPSYSAVRATLAVLVKRGHLRFVNEANRYVYVPTVEPDAARKTALRHLMQTFFEGSASRVVSTLLEDEAAGLSSDELDHLSRMIEQAKKEGR